MSTTLTTTALKATISWDYENVLTLGNTTNISTYNYLGGSNGQLAQGTSSAGTVANVADKIYAATGTINASANLTIALTNGETGSVTDFFGNNVVMARLKVLYFENQNTGTANTSAVSVLIGNQANALLNWVGANTHTVRVRNGGLLMLSAPDAVAYVSTSSTADKLLFLNEDSTNACTYRVLLIGAST